MTPTPARVFVARLTGTSVFDPNGDQVGKVRDVLVTLRHGGQPPRVLGLIVEVAQRRRIFLPMTRVTGMDGGQVVTTGVLNVRRFSQRPGETLVVGELFDRTVTLLETGETVTILDAGFEQARDRDWFVTAIHLRRSRHHDGATDPGGERGAAGRGRGGRVGRVGSALRRRGETLTVEWDAVSGLSLEDPDQGVESLLATMETMRSADLAHALHELPPSRRLQVARELDDERLADVLEELPERDRVQILGVLDAERAADILEEMDPDDAADLLGELPPEVADRLLALVQPDDAEDLRRLLTYDDYTAGGLMTTEPVILPPDATVAEALARIRSEDLAPSLAAQVYVVRAPLETPTGKYLGTAHFQRLLREPPSTLVSAVVDRDLAAVGPEAPMEAITRYFATYNLVAIAVVDETRRLLGAVTVDDVLDHMLPEDWREQDHEDEVDPGLGEGGIAPGIGTGGEVDRG